MFLIVDNGLGKAKMNMDALEPSEWMGRRYFHMRPAGPKKPNRSLSLMNVTHS